MMGRTGASRSVALAWFVLIGSGCAAWAQGAMTPGGPAVAPPPRVAPPPPAVTAPTPPTIPAAPTVTPRTPTTVTPVVPPPPPALPSASSQGTPRSSGPIPTGSTSSIFDRWGNMLAGVGVSSSGPNGPRTAVSDTNGAVSLGRLSPGVHELTVSTRSVATASGGNQPAPQMLIGLLLPAVQPARAPVAVETAVQPNGGDLHIRLGVDSKGQVTSVDWGNGKGAIGVYVAAGDVNGDGRAEVATGRRQYEPLLARAPDQAHIVFGGLSNSGTFTVSGAATRGTPNVRVTATGTGGVFQGATDGQGTTRLGKLPVGNTDIEFNGDDLRSAVRTAGPTAPTPQKTTIELLVVIAIIALKTDGQPVVFLGSFPANAVPKSIKANLRIGRDGNPMEVNWGNGPQAPQAFNVTGTVTNSGSMALGGITGTIANNAGGTYTQSGGTTTNAGTFANSGTVAATAGTGGTSYTGATNVNAGTLQGFRDFARTAKPGDVAINSTLQDVSTTR